MNAESAVLRQVDEFTKAFERVDDPYIRERGADLRDVGRRIIEKLTTTHQEVCDFKEPVIVVARELTPSDTVRLDRGKVLAFATESGGKESHAAILARSLGIPAVVGLEGLRAKVAKGDLLAVDGDMGTIVINPPRGDHAELCGPAKEAGSIPIRSLREDDRPAFKTQDGHPVQLWANIGCLADLEYAVHFQAHGVGLYRTEMPALVWGHFLSEEEQSVLYQKVVSRSEGREVTIRTLDFGGDKFLDGGGKRIEKNPFLGYRSIRIFLRETELFKQQIRAILKASAHGPVRMLFPMIRASRRSGRLWNWSNSPRRSSGPKASPSMRRSQWAR